MDKRVEFLDAEGLDYQVLFPTLGLLWEGEVQDPWARRRAVSRLQHLGV